jgi:glutamate synthase (NADPH/NADH) large chain
LAEHAKLTGSVLALAMLADFDDYVDHFWLVKPKATTLESLLKD